MGKLYKAHGKQFYNKDDSLTKYSLSCGYIEKFEKLNDYVKLEKDSACYHVKSFIKDTRNWESFDTLTQARNYYKLQKRAIKKAL